jgi:hypothetical protein
MRYVASVSQSVTETAKVELESGPVARPCHRVIQGAESVIQGSVVQRVAIVQGFTRHSSLLGTTTLVSFRFYIAFEHETCNTDTTWRFILYAQALKQNRWPCQGG